MIILNVPYAEKDQAKVLGARWNNDRKTWYVPDGQPTAPFEKWLTAPQLGQGSDRPSLVKEAKTKVDSYSGAPIVGEYYVELLHDCSPFVECAECLPILQRSGWKAAQDGAKEILDGIQPS